MSEKNNKMEFSLEAVLSFGSKEFLPSGAKKTVYWWLGEGSLVCG